MKYLLIFLLFACSPKASEFIAKDRVAQVFDALIVTPDGRNFDVTTINHTYTVVYNGQGEYRVYERVYNTTFGIHYEPTTLALSYQERLNEKRK